MKRKKSEKKNSSAEKIDIINLIVPTTPTVPSSSIIKKKLLFDVDLHSDVKRKYFTVLLL